MVIFDDFSAPLQKMAKNGHFGPPQAQKGSGGGRGLRRGPKNGSGGRGINVQKLSQTPITH